MNVAEVIKILEDIAPLSYQEDYDNCGLLIGNPNNPVKAILCTLDVTPEVLDEAISLKANLIICHHPVIFVPLKSLTGKSISEKVIIQAIKNDIAIYAAHTNLDNSNKGVNHVISEKLGLRHCKILKPGKSLLYKLVTFVPDSHVERVRNALFATGAGNIGNYDSCSFNINGKGSFRAGENTNPYVGEKGQLHFENETRIETIVPEDKLKHVLSGLKKSHPYEEIAYDIYPLRNEYSSVGSGMIGDLPRTMKYEEFLALLKTTFGLPVIRYAGNTSGEIGRVALCGGSGAFLLNKAIKENADAFLTGDIKYHQFFDADKNILFCDIGHYESEQFTKDFFYLLLNKKNSTFAVHLSKIITNPIKYYL